MRLLINGEYAEVINSSWLLTEEILNFELLYSEKVYEMIKFSEKENLPLILEIFSKIGSRNIHFNLDAVVKSFLREDKFVTHGATVKILKVWF